jgi:hypothetical protein
MLSERIGRMAAHLGGGNGGDADCKRKLTMATVTRRKVLSYMQRRDYGGYRLAVRELGLRPLPVFHSPYLPKVRPSLAPCALPGRGRGDATVPAGEAARRARARSLDCLLPAPSSCRKPQQPCPIIPLPSPLNVPQVRAESHKVVNARNAKLKNRVGRGWAGH